jgi:hypothetical protein
MAERIKSMRRSRSQVGNAEHGQEGKRKTRKVKLRKREPRGRPEEKQKLRRRKNRLVRSHRRSIFLQGGE